jgi:hypothetical protein
MFFFGGWRAFVLIQMQAHRKSERFSQTYVDEVELFGTLLEPPPQPLRMFSLTKFRVDAL